MNLRKAFGVAALGFLAGCMNSTTEQKNIEDLRAITVGYDHWDVQGRFRTRGNVAQNVTQPDLVTLLGGQTFVGYEESNRVGKGYGAISVAHYLASGTAQICLLSFRTGKPKDRAYGVREWASTNEYNRHFDVFAPRMQIRERDGGFTYGNVQYNADTGQFAEIGAIPGIWHDIRKGHLQAGIPAAVYTACPEFASAESLGTFVNNNQTSWNYFELIAQDPGQRILRPDLVTPFTAFSKSEPSAEAVE